MSWKFGIKAPERISGDLCDINSPGSDHSRRDLKGAPSTMKKARIVIAASFCFAVAGLFLLPASQADTTRSSSKQVTFTKDVAPIFFKNCAECHRAGEAAPFSVMSYKDVRPWAKSIREKVANREMPPWHADP